MNKISYVALAAALLVWGCDAGVAPTETKGYEMTEPRLVLADAEVSFERDGADALAACLADDFQFYFHPEEVGTQLPNGYILPARWTRAEFLDACAKTFAATKDVSINTSWRQCGRPGTSETRYHEPNLSFALTVLFNGNDGLILDAGTCDYEFSASGGLWRLSAWRDNTRECGCGEPPNSFGRVLASFYK